MPEIATVDGLPDFLDKVDGDVALHARSLTHAWLGGGGDAIVGKVAVRLTTGDPAFTAGTLHAAPARLELCRVLLERHGFDNDRWQQWCDEFADLGNHGFEATAKYPSVPLAALAPSDVARLVTGLRDLAAAF